MQSVDEPVGNIITIISAAVRVFPTSVTCSYVELSVAGRTDRIRPTIPKETIVKQVLDTEPLFKVAEPTD